MGSSVQVMMRDFAPEEDEAAFGLSDVDDVRYRFSGPAAGDASAQNAEQQSRGP